jgi:hypothetical protein
MRRAQGVKVMTLSEALEYIKKHHPTQRPRKVAHISWNGKGMYIFVVRHWRFMDDPTSELPLLPFIAMKTATNEIVPWLASQTDMLTEGWVIVP